MRVKVWYIHLRYRYENGAANNGTESVMGIYYSEDNVVCGFHYPAEPHKREKSDAIKNSELT
jgi:hypothetical protein